MPSRIDTFCRGILSLLLISLPLVESGTSADTIGLSQSDRQKVRGALVTGRVIDGTTGEAVLGAVVALRLRTDPSLVKSVSELPQAARALVDELGRFAFEGVGPGTYDFEATKPGYADGVFGRLGPNDPGRTLEIQAANRLVAAEIRLWRLGALSGTVLDDANEPVANVVVHSLRRDWIAGEPVFVPAGNARTDDRGRYVINSLLPGSYVVAAPFTLRSAPSSVAESVTAAERSTVDRAALGQAGVGPSWFGAGSAAVGRSVVSGDSLRIPDATRGEGRLLVRPLLILPTGWAQESSLDVRPGETAVAPALLLRFTHGIRIRGRLEGPRGPVPFAGLRLVPAAVNRFSTEAGFEAAATITDATGQFEFVGVAPGDYYLRGLKGPNDSGADRQARMLWLRSELTVSDKDADVRLTMREAFDVIGRMIFEGQRPAPTSEQLQRQPIYLDSADGRQRILVPPAYRSNEGYSFTIHGAPGGRYVARFGGNLRGWYLKSITLKGVDVLDAPIDLSDDVADIVLTFTDKVTELSGRARSGSGKPESAALVVVMPANQARWVEFGKAPHRFQTTRADPDGNFRIVGLPPGEYIVSAIEQGSSLVWQSRPALELLARAGVHTSLRDGEASSVIVRAVR